MNNEKQNTEVLKRMIELLELPDTAYEKAKSRYDDLGDWFNRSESLVVENDPHIFPQGSFRLGTAIRPLVENEEYDLDLACKLREGITKISHTQEELKNLVGQELENYRKYRNIKENLEPKHRCWRLLYQDDMSFHMDIVPCIPGDDELRKAIYNSLLSTKMDEAAATDASSTTVSITDDRHPNYKNISSDWKISNPEGYAKWFESRMNQQQLGILLNKAQVDSVPLFKRKTTLQRVIQLLKRHRDRWSKENPDVKPISIIITTLAARAYNGEPELSIALDSVLQGMGSLIQSNIPRVPNPVDPKEDFADRWYQKDSKHLRLEDNFRTWLLQAQTDFKYLASIMDIDSIQKSIEQKFSLRLDKEEFKSWIPSKHSYQVIPKKKTVNINSPLKPWGKCE